MYAELITAALALTPTTLVPRQRRFECPQPIKCPENNDCTSKAINGAVFKLNCETDFNGPVIEINQANNFAECVTACSLVPNCKGLNFKRKFCYLLGTPINEGLTASASNVKAATLARPATGKPSPTAGSSTCRRSISCPEDDACMYMSNTATFFARCNFDFYGGDLADGQSTVGTMKRCVDKCANTTGCVGVSYKHTTNMCFLKASLKQAVYSTSVNGAYLAGN